MLFDIDPVASKVALKSFMGMAHRSFGIGMVAHSKAVQITELVGLVSAARFIGAGLATIGVAGAGVGIGIVFAGYMLASARNEVMRTDLFRYAILGFALTEAMGLLAIMMAFLILFG